MSKTAYEILGVSPTATDEEIKRQYHTLIRGVHTDNTSLEELSDEERARCEEQVREYNGAFEELKKGRRATYDASLGLNRKIEETPTYSSSTTSTTNPYVDFSGEYEEKVRKKKQNLGPEFDALIEELFNNLSSTGFGYNFQGSYTTDPNQNLRQKYWKLESEKRKLERDLKEAERKAIIEFYRKEPNIEYQIESERRNVFSEFSRMELHKNTCLSGIEQEYLYKVSGRFVTNKKREKAKQILEKEQEKIMNEYNGAKKILEDKQRKLQSQREAYDKAKEDFIKNDPKVQSIQKQLLEIGLQMDTISEQLEMQKENIAGKKVAV